MKTQTKPGEFGVIDPLEGVRQPEVVEGHSEIERIELLATLTDENFKKALIVLNFEMMKSGKANAIALYNKPGGIELSDPILGKADNRCRFGEDPTKRSWSDETEVDELIHIGSREILWEKHEKTGLFLPRNLKSQQLLWEQDEKTGLLLPRTDLLAYMTGFPMGKLDYQGLTAEDVRRPTKAWLDLFTLHVQANPGFTGMILTNDGKKAGLLLFKIQEGKKFEPKFFYSIGDDDTVGREMVFDHMELAGVAHAEIDLTCRKGDGTENGTDKLTEKYEPRVKKAVDALYVVQNRQN